MKKTLIFIAALLFFALLTPGVSAAETQTSPEESLTEYYQSVLDSVSDAARGSYKGEAVQANAGVSDNLNPQNIFSAIWNTIVSRVSGPLSGFFIILAIVIACSLMDVFKDSLDSKPLSTTFSAVAVLGVGALIITPVMNCIDSITAQINATANFITSYIPIMAGIMITSGQPITAGTYNLFLFTLAQVMSAITKNGLVPLLGIYLALSVVGCLSPQMKLASLTKSLKTLFNITLGALATIFVGVLTMQGVAGNVADNAALKTGKFFASSIIPVVGSAISDAMGTMIACLQTLKTTVGIAGIGTIAAIFLPPVIEAVLWLLSLNAAAICADLLGAEKIGEMLRACGTTISLLLSITACFVLLIIVSTTIMLMFGVNI